MLRKNSLRFRYLISLLSIFIPIILFSFILIITSGQNSRQYANSTQFQQFNYASENITAIFDRLAYTATTAYNAENLLTVADGEIEVSSEPLFAAALSQMKERVSLDFTPLFYKKGDRSIYTTEGKSLFGEFENSLNSDFHLSLSGLFTRLQSVSSPKLIPLVSKSDSNSISGLAYVQPFPDESAGKSLLLFLLSEKELAKETENYLGKLSGDFLLFDQYGSLLYRSGQNHYMSASQAILVKGSGVHNLEENGKQLVLMRTVSTDYGLHFFFISSYESFYAESIRTERLLGLLSFGLIFIMLFMILWVTFFNYKPVGELFRHVVGREVHQDENELELIRGYYDQSIEDADHLASHLAEITPLVVQQFISMIISGRFASPEKISLMASYAGIHLDYPWNTMLYLSYTQFSSESSLEQALFRCKRYASSGCNLVVGSLVSENALCILLNFATEREPHEEVKRQLQEIYRHMEASGMVPRVIGVGTPSQDLTKMNLSFNEACVAAQLAKPEETFCFYGEESHSWASSENDIPQISPYALTLINEGIRRGDKVAALNALDGILHDALPFSHSLLFFRFYCSEMISGIVHMAENLQLPLNRKQIQQLIAISSAEEFQKNMDALVGSLCDGMEKRIAEEGFQMKQNLLRYIAENFCDSNLSVQTVSDDTGINKSQITSLLKEETGLGFAQYVSYLRHNECKRLLTHTDEAIQDIVAKIGYNDVPNFLRKFKTMEGMTPGQYRQLYRKTEN